MANGTTRWGSVLVALLVGFGLGWFLGRTKAAGRGSPGAPAKKHLVLVGPAADHLSEREVYLSKSDPREMIWLSIERQSLNIVFPRKQDKLPAQAQGKPPFAKMHVQGDDWVFDIPCSGGECFSGAINPDLQPKEWGELRYKYDQILADERKDGWIIIKP